MSLPLGTVHPGWLPALEPLAPQLAGLGEFLDTESASGRGWLPAEGQVLRAFESDPADVRVLIVGQDPYPTPGHPIGLSFAVERHVRPLPRSLANIYRELHDDLGIEPAEHGDLSAWSAAGVLLLNRVLTVRQGDAGSHRGRGWEAVTEAAIRFLAARGTPLVSILLGRQAQGLGALLAPHPVIGSAHPSPLSASRGFFGSRPFSRANAALVDLGAAPVDWRLSRTADESRPPKG